MNQLERAARQVQLTATAWKVLYTAHREGNTEQWRHPAAAVREALDKGLVTTRDALIQLTPLGRACAHLNYGTTADYLRPPPSHQA